MSEEQSLRAHTSDHTIDLDDEIDNNALQQPETGTEQTTGSEMTQQKQDSTDSEEEDDDDDGDEEEGENRALFPEEKTVEKLYLPYYSFVVVAVAMLLIIHMYSALSGDRNSKAIFYQKTFNKIVNQYYQTPFQRIGVYASGVCPLGTELIELGRWPGFEHSCYCESNEKYYDHCTFVHCSEKTTIPDVEPRTLTLWNNVLCGRRVKDFLPNRAECPQGYVHCTGSCYLEEEGCPDHTITIGEAQPFMVDSPVVDLKVSTEKYLCFDQQSMETLKPTHDTDFDDDDEEARIQSKCGDLGKYEPAKYLTFKSGEELLSNNGVEREHFDGELPSLLRKFNLLAVEQIALRNGTACSDLPMKQLQGWHSDYRLMMRCVLLTGLLAFLGNVYVLEFYVVRIYETLKRKKRLPLGLKAEQEQEESNKDAILLTPWVQQLMGFVNPGMMLLQLLIVMWRKTKVESAFQLTSIIAENRCFFKTELNKQMVEFGDFYSDKVLNLPVMCLNVLVIMVVASVLMFIIRRSEKSHYIALRIK